jgi:hypothetical protein
MAFVCNEYKVELKNGRGSVIGVRSNGVEFEWLPIKKELVQKFISGELDEKEVIQRTRWPEWV